MLVLNIGSKSKVENDRAKECFKYGRYELNKLTSLPMFGFIAQLVEHRTGIAEVTDSNPVEALMVSGFFFPIA